MRGSRHTVQNKAYILHMVDVPSGWLYSLLLETQYQPVIQNILLRLPCAVPKQEWSNM